MKIEAKNRLLVSAGWFEELEPDLQKDYITKHPNSKYAKDVAKGKTPHPSSKPNPGTSKSHHQSIDDAVGSDIENIRDPKTKKVADRYRKAINDGLSKKYSPDDIKALGEFLKSNGNSVTLDDAAEEATGKNKQMLKNISKMRESLIQKDEKNKLWD